MPKTDRFTTEPLQKEQRKRWQQTTDIPSYLNNIVLFVYATDPKNGMQRQKKTGTDARDERDVHQRLHVYVYIYIYASIRQLEHKCGQEHESGRQRQFARACTGKDPCGLHKDALFSHPSAVQSRRKSLRGSTCTTALTAVRQQPQTRPGRAPGSPEADKDVIG